MHWKEIEIHGDCYSGYHDVSGDDGKKLKNEKLSSVVREIK